MSYPALDDLAADIEIGHVAWRVYMLLKRDWLNLRTPTEVKVSGLADAWHMRKASVTNALNLLVERGYLIEHDRGPRGARRFTLEYDVRQRNTDRFPNRPHLAA